MKKAFFLVFCLLFFMNCASAKSVQFTVVSGALVKADSSVKFANKMTPSINKLLTAQRDINLGNSDFVIFLGDNTYSPDKYSLSMFSKIIRNFKKPVYTIVGDKDVQQTKGLEKKEYYRLLNLISLKKNKVPHLPYAKEINGFVFLFVDGTNQFVPSRNGYYKEDMITWLMLELEKHKNKPVIIAQHYPIFPFGKIDSSKLPIRVEDYTKILEGKNNVLLIISGHNGVEDEFYNGTIYNISMPNLGTSGEYKKVSVQYDDDTKEAYIKTRLYEVE